MEHGWMAYTEVQKAEESGGVISFLLQGTPSNYFADRSLFFAQFDTGYLVIKE